MVEKRVDIVFAGRDRATGVMTRLQRGAKAFAKQLVSIRGLIAGVGITAAVGQMVRLYSAQEKAEERLAANLRLRGELTAENVRMLKAEASALQDVSTVGDEVSLGSQALALAMGATAKQAAQVSRVAVDMSAALGMDVESAARNAAKTLGGYAGELGEVIPELKALTTEQLRAGEGLDLLARKFGGAAAAIGGTDKAIRQLRNAVGDFAEQQGKRLLTFLDKLVGGASGATGKLAALTRQIQVLNELQDARTEINKRAAGLPQPQPGGLAGAGQQLNALMQVPFALIATKLFGPRNERLLEAWNDQRNEEGRKRVQEIVKQGRQQQPERNPFQGFRDLPGLSEAMREAELTRMFGFPRDVGGPMPAPVITPEAIPQASGAPGGPPSPLVSRFLTGSSQRAPEVKAAEEMNRKADRRDEKLSQLLREFEGLRDDIRGGSVPVFGLFNPATN